MAMTLPVPVAMRGLRTRSTLEIHYGMLCP